MNRKLPKDWDSGLPTFTSADGPMATRIASGKTIEVLASHLPELMGGSADLAPSTHTNMDGAGNFEPENWAGRNMHFGIREHAMGAILNGMALHRGLIPYGGTFLIFSDYMRPPMRLAAMNSLPVIYVFTHDSIAMGEDGPTHQPVEQLMGLRSIPDMVVLRPADANETVSAWRIAIGRNEGPIALVLTRQGLPVLDLSRYPGIPDGVQLGGYILADCDAETRPDIILIATGSEVHLALESRERLATDGVQVRVVSMPSTNLFSAQSDEYRDKVLIPGVPLLVIEAGVSLGWRSYVGPQIAVIGVDTFGASAPGPIVMDHYGFTVDNICSRTRHLLLETQRKS
jgi:transketolase